MTFEALHSLKLSSAPYTIVISQLSPDDTILDHSVTTQYTLGEGYKPFSCYSIEIVFDGMIIRSCVVTADGGASGVYGRSAFLRSNTCYIAVGPFVCAFCVPELKLLWHRKVDDATCFGVYNAENYQSVISHGELEIVRLDYDGNHKWSSSGRDIFSGEFSVYEHHIVAVDLIIPNIRLIF